MNLKATLLRYCDLSWKSLTEIKSWFKRSGARDGFNVESFNNPKLQVISATNEDGQTVAHCLVESCYLFSAYLTNPEFKGEPEQQQAGNVIDGALAHLAQREGITKLLIVLPDSFPSQPEERWVRTVERKVPQIAAIQAMGSFTQLPATRFLN